jgi:hypothetical protein
MRDLFTPDEWQLLLDVPALAGTAMMVAGKSGLGTVKESFAIAQGILSGAKDHPESPLIHELVTARKDRREKSGVESLSGPYFGMDVNQLQQCTLDKAASAADLIRRKCGPSETGVFMDWVISIAERVASAAKEGDFLGFGGTRVSEEETAFLKLLKQRVQG